jgi:NAD(P)-dependent dehydrogenase (short-subunit alcohol dehydrogenase family)
VTSVWLADGRSGHISVVNIASAAGDLKGVAPAWCSASKAVVAGYTRYLAVALGPRIRANAMAPGFVETRRNSGLVASDLGDRIRARCLCNDLLSRGRCPSHRFPALAVSGPCQRRRAGRWRLVARAIGASYGDDARNVENRHVKAIRRCEAGLLPMHRNEEAGYAIGPSR